MTRAEQKAIQARIAIKMLAQLAAKNAIKVQIRAKGLRIWDFSSKDITLRAEAWLLEHPEMFAEARARAVSLGYAVAL